MWLVCLSNLIFNFSSFKLKTGLNLVIGKLLSTFGTMWVGTCVLLTPL